MTRELPLELLLRRVWSVAEMRGCSFTRHFFYDSFAKFKDKCTNLLFEFDIEAYMKDYFKIKL